MSIKCDFKKGDRIKMVYAAGADTDPRPIKPGTCGTVEFVNHISFGGVPEVHVNVLWDDGRILNAILPADVVEKLQGKN